MKWSGEGPGNLLGVLGRMNLSTALRLRLLVALRHKRPWHRSVRRTCLSGTIGVYGAMLCIYWAARYVPSGLIAVLFGLSPLVTAVIAQPLLGEPGITPARAGQVSAGRKKRPRRIRRGLFKFCLRSA